jgi:hypothetical protein
MNYYRSAIACIITLIGIFVLSYIPCNATQTLGIGGSGFFGANTQNLNNAKYYYGSSLITEYELSGAYRDGLILNCGFAARRANNNRGGVYNGTIGLKYVPEFYFPKNDITENTFNRNKLSGFLLMPFTIIRDAMADVSLALTPDHPFIFAGAMFGKKESSNYHLGYFVAPGLTSGFLDAKVKFSQCFYPGSNMKQAFKEIALELTFHVSFTGNQVRIKSQSAEEPSAMKLF